MKKAQVSLEYLIVLLAFFTVFAMLLPFISNAFHASIFALDSLNAKNFANSIEQAISEEKVLGNGSSISLEANPFLEWRLFSQEEKLFLIAKNKQLGKEKIFSIIFPNKINFSEIQFNSKKIFLLKKENGLVLFENLD